MISFSSDNYNVSEAAGNATVTLTRSGGTDSRVAAKISLTDLTTTLGADYLFAPGSLDTSFNPGSGTDDLVRGLATQPDSKVIIGGLFESYNGTTVNSIARINTDGSLDTSFNTGTGALGVRALAVQSDGKVLIGGSFNSYNGTATTPTPKGRRQRSSSSRTPPVRRSGRTARPC